MSDAERPQVVFNIDPQKRKKFKLACTSQDQDMAKVLRQFIHKFIRSPKECIDFIKQ